MRDKAHIVGLAPVASFGVEQLLQELCRQASRFVCKRKWTKPNPKHGRFGTQFDKIEPRCAMFKSAQIILLEYYDNELGSLWSVLTETIFAMLTKCGCDYYCLVTNFQSSNS